MRKALVNLLQAYGEATPRNQMHAARLIEQMLIAIGSMEQAHKARSLYEIIAKEMQAAGETPPTIQEMDEIAAAFITRHE